MKNWKASSKTRSIQRRPVETPSPCDFSIQSSTSSEFGDDERHQPLEQNGGGISDDRYDMDLSTIASNSLLHQNFTPTLIIGLPGAIHEGDEWEAELEEEEEEEEVEDNTLGTYGYAFASAVRRNRMGRGAKSRSGVSKKSRRNRHSSNMSFIDEFLSEREDESSSGRMSRYISKVYDRTNRSCFVYITSKLRNLQSPSSCINSTCQMLQYLWFALLIFTIFLTLNFANRQMHSVETPVYNLPASHSKQMTRMIKSRPSHQGRDIPSIYSNLEDVIHLSSLKRLHRDAPHTLPYYWHIPRSMGGTMTDVMTTCFKLVLASHARAKANYKEENSLRVLRMPQASLVNVDLSTIQGISHAGKLNLAQSSLANAIMSSHIYQISSYIFTPKVKGRMFAVFRHPVHRAVSLFHYTQDTVWRRAHTEEYQEIKILDYFKGGASENNWMTRFILNEKTRELTEDDLETAKEILRRKCLVGLFHKKSETMDRFQKYFGWSSSRSGEKGEECLDQKLNWNWPGKHRHDEVEEGSEVWDAIAMYNDYDMRLYEYAKELFKDQAALF